MKALTIRQPHAWAVARGLKPIENRPGAFSWRGPVMIHAGQQNGSPIAWQEVEHLAALEGVTLPMLGGPGAPTECAYGAVIAVADLVDSHRWDHCPGQPCSPWAHRGSAHNRLANTRILRRPVPARGNTILWTPDADLVAEVRAVLPT